MECVYGESNEEAVRITVRVSAVRCQQPKARRAAEGLRPDGLGDGIVFGREMPALDLRPYKMLQIMG